MIEDLEQLSLIITGGEYRRALPGRGITKVTVYRPLGEVLSDLAAEISEWLPELFERWEKEIRKAEKRAIRRVNYLVRTGKIGS
jgi:hypothetical protein